MIISHIVAVSRNWVIGKNNDLPWHMPEDFQYFHEKTMGHIVIMGRKNYQSNKKALPGRLNIVITRNKNFRPKDAVTAENVEAAIEYAKKHIAQNPEKDEVFIAGGGEIYRQSLEFADRIYITVIDAEVEGDTYYPRINFADYTLISEDHHIANKENPHNWTYYILEK